MINGFNASQALNLVGTIGNAFMQPKADPQAFAAKETSQWEDPTSTFQIDPAFINAYDQAPDSAKGLMQTLAFMGPLTKASERAADRHEAAANRLLDRQLAAQREGAQFTGQLKMNLGAMEMIGNTMNGRPSIVTPWTQRGVAVPQNGLLSATRSPLA